MLHFDTTEELAGQPIVIIGQSRAVEAIKLGLELRSAGYNIFVAGEVGTGCSTDRAPAARGASTRWAAAG